MRSVTKYRIELLALLVSLALHSTIAISMLVNGLMPRSPLEFRLPSEVEFGFSEVVARAEPVEPPDEPANTSSNNGGSGPGLDAGVRDAARRDGSTRDGGRRRREVGSDGAGDAAEGSDAGDFESEMAVSGVPRGSLMALRMNFDRLRISRLEGPLRALLARIPEWRFVLEGSNIDPLRDLSRLMLVMADPRRRDQLVVSGALVPSAPNPEAIAAQMATARGESIVFEEQDGLRVAAWHDIDPTERVIATTDAQTFLIANRALTLSTLIRWAATRAQSLARTCTGAECLRSLGDPPEGIDVEFEVQGAAAYFAFNEGRFPGTLCQVPRTIEVRSNEHESGVRVQMRGHYPDAAAAREAAGCLHLVREQYLGLAAGFGFGPPLEQITFHTEEGELEVETNFSFAEAQSLITLITGLLPQ